MEYTNTVNRSQTHECGNWDCGRAIPFVGIFVSNFRHWFFAVYNTSHFCVGKNSIIINHAESNEFKFGKFYYLLGNLEGSRAKFFFVIDSEISELMYSGATQCSFKLQKIKSSKNNAVLKQFLHVLIWLNKLPINANQIIKQSTFSRTILDVVCRLQHKYPYPGLPLDRNRLAMSWNM